jgi:hypothetical protein
VNLRLHTFCIIIHAPTRPEHIGCGCWIIGRPKDRNGYIAQLHNGGGTVTGPERCFLPLWRAPVVAA